MECTRQWQCRRNYQDSHPINYQLSTLLPCLHLAADKGLQRFWAEMGDGGKTVFALCPDYRIQMPVQILERRSAVEGDVVPAGGVGENGRIPVLNKNRYCFNAVTVQQVRRFGGLDGTGSNLREPKAKRALCLQSQPAYRSLGIAR